MIYVCYISDNNFDKKITSSSGVQCERYEYGETLGRIANDERKPKPLDRRQIC